MELLAGFHAFFLVATSRAGPICWGC